MFPTLSQSVLLGGIGRFGLLASPPSLSCDSTRVTTPIRTLDAGGRYQLLILRDTVRFSARCKTNHTYSDRYFGVALAVSMNAPRTIGISRFVPRLTPSSRKTLIWEERDQTVTVQRPTPFQRLNASTPQPNPRALRLLLLCCGRDRVKSTPRTGPLSFGTAAWLYCKHGARVRRQR